MLEWLSDARLQTHLRTMFHERAERSTRSARPSAMHWYEGNRITKKFDGSPLQVRKTGGEAVTGLGSLTTTGMMLGLPLPNNRDEVAGVNYSKLEDAITAMTREV